MKNIHFHLNRISTRMANNLHKRALYLPSYHKQDASMGKSLVTHSNDQKYIHKKLYFLQYSKTDLSQPLLTLFISSDT